MKIGILASTSKTQYFINQAYADYVTESGFQPVLIVPGCDVITFSDLIDGLLLPGGIDLDPIYYGEDNYTSFSVDPEKDAFEREFFHAVRELGKPIFGICRGFQLIIREYMVHDDRLGEFLEFCTHIGEHAQTSGQQLERNVNSHFVDYRSGHMYPHSETDAGIVHMAVNSMHHQCLTFNRPQDDVVAIRGFNMLAWTTRGLKVDRKEKHKVVCEAFSIRGWKAPILAVQWHPEELRDHELLRSFFNTYSNQGSLADAAV